MQALLGPATFGRQIPSSQDTFEAISEKDFFWLEGQHKSFTTNRF
jgi:hypothetical protein